VPEYLAPGVYVEETSFRAPSIEGVGTSTAAFVGPTLTGPVAGTPLGAIPELLTSFGDFSSIYGGFDNLTLSANSADAKNINYLALSVKAFFDNGGSRLYVSRVFSAKGDNDSGKATGGAVGDDKVAIQARYPGSMLNGETVTVTLNAVKTKNVSSLPPGSLLVQLTPPAAADGDVVQTFYANGIATSFKKVSDNSDFKLPDKDLVYAVTLSVAAPSASGAISVYEGLGLDPNHPLYIGSILGPNPPRRIDALENQVQFSIGAKLTADKLFGALFPKWGDPSKPAFATFPLTGGNDGGEPAFADYVTALKSLEALEDIAIVAAPGSAVFADAKDGGSSTADQVVSALITHVERPRAYRVAILDTPPNYIASQVEEVRSKIDSSYSTLYTPWIVTANPLARPGTSSPTEVTVPPSGFMAGIFARNDREHSVAKAPANEVVLGALRLERNINFAEQGVLNPAGINCVRFFSGRGYRVWGARNATSNSEIKYVNVRRYLVYLEHSIDRGSQWAVFENNGPLLWARVKESVEEFLYNEFVQKNLLGTSPAEAYFVRCDRSTMTQNNLDNGQLICLIGVALLKPAEFVIFRIGQKTADARS
jgi:phage tail sheath protein FI